jgi:protein TonB
MAYVQTLNPHRRALTIGVVGVLHAALGYALIIGFAATMLEKVDILVPTRQWPAEPTTPEIEPTVAPSPASAANPLTAPQPKLALGAQDGATVIELSPGPTPSGFTGAIELGPIGLAPSPSASFAPRGAMPLGSPGRWATSADYPATALREEREGVARFRVTVGADGRVNNCEIISSSGSSDLDRATCANVAKRARFKPATDENGAEVSGSYTSAVKWEIPG